MPPVLGNNTPVTLNPPEGVGHSIPLSSVGPVSGAISLGVVKPQGSGLAPIPFGGAEEPVKKKRRARKKK